MEEIFISELKINKVRHLENIKIPISKSEKKHLILTGKNGSGKTSVLEKLRWNLHNLLDNRAYSVSDLEMIFSNSDKNVASKFHKSEFICAFFDAKRTTQFHRPRGVEKVNIRLQSGILADKINRDFLKYLVDLKARRAFANEEGKEEKALEIDRWFLNFERLLQEIFNDKNLRLDFDFENYNFNIIQSNKEKFDFNTLSDGYSAILNILTDLIMRMERHGTLFYNLEGIVLIDEVEAHLHIELQKQILPFLTKVFPKIQFIVTTHSPFVLNSISNAVIFDLENKILVTDLSGYSVENIIEGYFDSDKYSLILKKEVEEYELLWKKSDLTDEELDKLKQLHQYFKNLPKYGAAELELKIKEIELSKIRKL